MGKLDQSLLNIKANARASRKGPDLPEEPVPVVDVRMQEPPVMVVEASPAPAPVTRMVRPSPKPTPSPEILAQDPLPASKAGSERVFPSRSLVTKHSSLLDKARLVERFTWHENIELCRTQANADEEFKKLRTNVVNMISHKGFKTLLFTSCRHSEGKTTTSTALARCLAGLSEKKVCLVDGDLRRPQVKAYLGLEVTCGLDDVVQGDADLADAMIHSKEDNLTVIPTRRGRGVASELLGSERMGAIVGALRDEFDIIIFDSPPCQSTTDPIVLGGLMDAVTLAVKMNHTPRQSVEYAIGMMRHAQVPFVGLVLTHHVIRYKNYLLQKYNYYHDYRGYYYYQEKIDESKGI
ncbi:MAG: polysaccharide biosynthesis tyrosine autokinase [Planctomycetota bacterium]